MGCNYWGTMFETQANARKFLEAVYMSLFNEKL